MNDYTIYLCGGAVRDIIAGRKPKDKDYVVMAPSFDELIRFVEQKGGKIFVRNPEFNTIRASFPNIGCADFVLPRRDIGYSDNRRPDATEVTNSLVEDSNRRDFTINAMYMPILESGEPDTTNIIDFHNGVEHLKNGIIHCVGDPSIRFQEDSLRIIRAFRFAICRNFKISYDTLIAAIQNANLLQNLPAERITEELNKMFEADTNRTISMIKAFPEIFSFFGNDSNQVTLIAKKVY